MKYLKILLATLAVLILLMVVAKYVFKVNPPLGILGSGYEGPLPMDSLKLPEGFAIEVYADSIENARSLCYAPDGILYVGTRSAGNVYALVDEDGDFKIDNKYTLLSGANMPNGVAWKDGDLYIAEVNRILRIKNVAQKLENPGVPEVIYDKYPTDTHHGWKYIAFGPDGKLYVPVGAPCNVCLSDAAVYASLTRLNTDGSGFEIVHQGIRNTVGFAWHPTTGQLWFTDNGRDMMGDDIPECELNSATEESQHFGFPFCHAGTVPDPEFGKQRSCDEFRGPAVTLGPHTAPLGLTFIAGSQFPGKYTNQILVARHGSWNRSKKSGYDVSLVELDSNYQVQKVSPFVEGWLDAATDDVWGRPVDFEQLPDGSLLISDDYANVIYRVYYKN
jgi:glucose/arabinose dehydrogenase